MKSHRRWQSRLVCRSCQAGIGQLRQAHDTTLWAGQTHPLTASTSLTVTFRPFSSTSPSTNFAPCLANSTAQARPKPDPAPVMRQTRPLNRAAWAKHSSVLTDGILIGKRLILVFYGLTSKAASRAGMTLGARLSLQAHTTGLLAGPE